MSELHDRARQWSLDAGIATTSIVGLHAVKARMLIAELLAENERLTARLRELANEEPVACVCTYEGSDGIPFSVFIDPDTARRSPPDVGEPVPLILRPAMP